MSDEVIIKGIGRLAWQFSDSEKFIEFLNSFLDQFQDLYDSEQQLLLERYLLTAEGVQLDGIGEIVGLVRPTIPNAFDGFFGFVNDPTSLGFTKLSDLDLGGHFISIVESRIPATDDVYRLLIQAKIILNQTSMTVDETLNLISFTFGGVQVRYFLIENLKPRYDIGKMLTAFDKELLENFLPVLIGIDKVNYHTIYTSTPFSFLEDTIGDTYGFGTLLDSEIGGNLSRILDTAT